MIGHKAKRARDGYMTKRCKAVTADGPCKNWTSFEYCHAHEWKMEQIVIGAHQSFVMEYPRALAKLVSVMHTCRDPYIFLQSFDRFINHMKYISGDKTAIGQQSTGFADLDTHQLIERATRAISALQQPTAVAPGAYNGQRQRQHGCTGCPWSNNRRTGRPNPRPGTGAPRIGAEHTRGRGLGILFKRTHGYNVRC